MTSLLDFRFLTLIYCCVGLSVSETPSSSGTIDNKVDNIVKCLCMITADMKDDSPYHNFGVIRTYHLDPLLDRSKQCHHIKHSCRRECTLRTDLHVDVQNGMPLGKVLCTKLGIDTPDGGAPVKSRGYLEAERQCGETAEYSISHDQSNHRLCCGHSLAGPSGSRLGWNPDCEYRNFVLV